MWMEICSGQWSGSRGACGEPVTDDHSAHRVLGWARAERGDDDARMCGGEDRNGRSVSAKTDDGGKVGGLSQCRGVGPISRPCDPAAGTRASGGTTRYATLVATRAAAISR